MTETSLVARIAGGPSGLVRLLKRLGPVFVRYGQLMALRPDLIPPEIRDEFLLQLASVPQALPWNEARACLAEELGDLDSLLRSIDPVPVFANGLTQIHPAVTAGGQNVLIKFLLPGVNQRVRKDARRAWILARLLPLGHKCVQELAILVDLELDLLRERENLGKLAAASEKNPCIRIPKLYPEFSTARVLTTENLGGVPLLPVLASAGFATFRSNRPGFQANELATRLIEGVTRQILQRRFYCADLHPLNLLLLPDNTVSFVNFGHCEALDAPKNMLYARFMSDAFSTELPRMAHFFAELLIQTETSAPESLRDDFTRECHKWLRLTVNTHRVRRAADYSSSLANWLVAILRAARGNRFGVPPEMLSVFRSLVTVETLAIRLDPAIHLQSTGEEILKDIVLEDVFERVGPVKIRSTLVNVLTALSNAPEYLNQILADSAKGRLQLGLNVSEHPHTTAMRDRRHKLLASAIAAVGIAWLMGEPGLPSLGPFPVVTLLGILLAVLYLRMLVLWRKLE